MRDTAADAHTHSPIHTCTWKMSDMQLEPGPGDQDTHSRGDCSAETEVQVKTVQYLLGELKALIAGQGESVYRHCLCTREQDSGTRFGCYGYTCS